MIKFQCPHCGVKISAEPEHYGASANCPSCGGDMVVPNPPNEDAYTSQVAPCAIEGEDQPNEHSTRGKSSSKPEGKKWLKTGAFLLLGLLVIAAAFAITRPNRKGGGTQSKSTSSSTWPNKGDGSESVAATPYPSISTDQEISREELAYALRAYEYLEKISEPRRKDALIENLLVVANREFSTRHPVTEIFRSKERLRDYLSEVYSNAKKIETKLDQLEPSDFDALQRIQIDTICWGATLALISKNIRIDDRDSSYRLTITSLNGYLFTLGNMAGYAAASGILSKKNDKTADGVMRLRMLIAEYKSAQERLPMSRFRFEDQMKENFGE